MSSTDGDRAARLAAQPMRPAGPQPGLAAGAVDSVRDIWSRRELLGLLVRRELKARYKDSALGFVWSLVRPLTMLLIYYVAVGKFLGAQRQIPQFAVYIFAGLTAWTLASEIITAGTASVVNNGGLVKKVYLPRELFPLASIGSALFNFAIQLVVLVGATFVVGQPPRVSDLGHVVLGFALVVVFSTAVALVMSATNVYLRDVQYLVEIAMMVLFWASPIVYSWAQVSPHLDGVLHELYLANPFTLAVLAFQRGFWVAGRDAPVPTDLDLRLAVTLAASVVLLWIGQRVFARLQGSFAQEL